MADSDDSTGSDDDDDESYETAELEGLHQLEETRDQLVVYLQQVGGRAGPTGALSRL